MAKLLILGASRYYQRAILTARRLGHHTIVVDANPNAAGRGDADVFEPIDITDGPGCLDAAVRHGIDGVLALNDFGVPTAAMIAQRLGLPGLTPAVADIATNKWSMRSLMEKAAVPIPHHRLIRTEDEARLAFRQLGNAPVIVKPADSRGGGSRGVSVVDNERALPEAFAFAHAYSPDLGVLVEEWMIGSEHSAEVIMLAGRAYLLAISDKVKTPLPYRVDKAVLYPSTLDVQAVEQARRLAETALMSVGLADGIAHVELCFTQEGPKIIEFGARPGGGGTADPILPQTSGLNLIEIAIDLALGNDVSSKLTPLWRRGAVYWFLTPQPGVLRRIENLEVVMAHPQVLDAAVTVDIGHPVRPVRVGGDRSGFVITAGETLDEALAAAYWAEETLAFIVDPP